MIIFFNNLAITAKFYNAENITNYLALLKIIPNVPHVSEFYGSRRLLARINYGYGLALLFEQREFRAL